MNDSCESAEHEAAGSPPQSCVASQLHAVAVALAALVLLLAITFWTWSNAEQEARHVSHQAFDFRVSQTRPLITQRLAAYRQMLLGGVGSGAIQNGFLMYVPVYVGNAPLANAEERRARLLGYVYAPFRMSDLIDGIDTRESHLILFGGTLISALVAMIVWSLLVSRKQSRVLAKANRDLRREIDERVRLEAELSRVKEVAESANRAKSEFLANVSHAHLSTVSGLDLGADDYLVKPFSPDELRVRLRAVERELHERSREAAVSMLACGILHNLGNALNGVTASAVLIREQIDRSSGARLSKVAKLLQSHDSDLPGFFARDPRARLLPGYLSELADQLDEEAQALATEASVLVECGEHAREVIASHHRFARPSSGVREVILAGSIMDSAYTLARAGVNGHGITVEREYDPLASIVTDRHKVLQILVNLIGNALQAMRSGVVSPHLVLTVTSSSGRVYMTVKDNGVGIAANHLSMLFNQRFTTRADGNGLGLHSSANWAHELDGQLHAHSDGPGHGSVFTLDLPSAWSLQNS